MEMGNKTKRGGGDERKAGRDERAMKARSIIFSPSPSPSSYNSRPRHLTSSLAVRSLVIEFARELRRRKSEANERRRGAAVASSPGRTVPGSDILCWIEDRDRELTQ